MQVSDLATQPASQPPSQAANQPPRKLATHPAKKPSVEYICNIYENENDDFCFLFLVLKIQLERPQRRSLAHLKEKRKNYVSQRKWGKDAYRPPFSFQHIIAHPTGMRVDSDNEKYFWKVVVWGLTHMKSHARTNTKFFTGWCKCWPPLTPTSDPQKQRKSQAKFCNKNPKTSQSQHDTSAVTCQPKLTKY